MDIVINDANIFFDLINVGLLDEFFQLPFEFHTLELVVHEIDREEQRKAVQKYIDNGRLKVKTYDGEDFLQVALFANSLIGNLSLTDSSVLYYALQMPGCRILTGDRQLRNRATEYHVQVSGVIFVFDKLIEYGVLTKEKGARKIKELLLTNPRLPRTLIEERINKWSK